jgi:hypothetical protein
MGTDCKALTVHFRFMSSFVISSVASSAKTAENIVQCGSRRGARMYSSDSRLRGGDDLSKVFCLPINDQHSKIPYAIGEHGDGG